MNECASCRDFTPTQNVVPILHEIRHALRKLIDSGESTIIDLRAMPFAPGEERELEERLGEGEVQVKMEALGPSEIRETGISGVWLVTHYSSDGEDILSRFIEITRVPSILESQTEDMESGLQTLQESLATGS